jgi:hypothetical protein
MPTATDTNGAAPVTETRAAVPISISRPRVVKPVPITLDKDRTMVMDFTAMEAFEDATGLSAWGREAWDGRPRTVVALIWAALLHEDPELALDDLKKMPCMTLGNMAYLTERLGELWGETMPDADASTAASETEGDADPNPRRRAG